MACPASLKHFKLSGGTPWLTKQSLQRASRNRAARTRVKNAVKQVRVALQGNDKAQAGEALVAATSVLSKAAGKGALHWKKAARKISRLARAVNGLEAAE